MSMSTSIQGFKPADSKWLAMKKVWDACEKAGVEAVDISAAVVKRSAKSTASKSTCVSFRKTSPSFGSRTL